MTHNPFAETNARASAHDAPAPGGSTRPDSAARAAARRILGEGEKPAECTITHGHQMAFQWLRHDEDTPFGLVSCYVNGHPSALIVAGRVDHGGKTVEIMPLFIALTKGMRVTTPDGDVIYENGGAA